MAAVKYLLKISMFIHIIFMVTVIIVLGAGANPQLNPNYYKTSCGNVLDIIKPVVRNAVRKEARMAASLLRLHFHDCFVNGCDGSLLLDDAPSFSSEKNAFPNKNSARGFDVIDAIKREVEKSCPGVVSCADILAIAARDAVVLSNGPYWNVHLGRRDSRTASRNRANTNIPSPEFNVRQLISNFVNEGLSIRDLVALSGAHTIGQARCATFRDRVYNKTAPINPRYATVLEKRCPASAPRGDNNLSPLDMGSATIFDNSYFKNLKHERGLLRSDQALLSSASTASIVQSYIDNPLVFYNDFKEAMVKMGNIKPLTGNNGQIRKNCRRVNS